MIHSGTFTIENPRTSEYRTFLVKKRQDEKSSFMPGKRLVGLLVGPDNYHDFRLFGYVDENSQTIAVFRKHEGTVMSKYARMLNVLVAQVETDIRLNDYKVLESRFCRRCGRQLTTPDSIEAGIGPECMTKE